MIDQTKIEWTDFTVNAWEGCQKVGPGCDHCYAEARDLRFTGGSHWGPGASRRKVKGGIAKLRKIQRDAPAFHATNGRWPRVFCSSLSDVFDNAVLEEWRAEFLLELYRADRTQPQLLTKRIGNVEKMVHENWRVGYWPRHIGLMITVVNQEEADRDIPKLLDLKARFGIPWVGLSMEPLLGPVDLTRLQPTIYEAKANALTGVWNWKDGPIRKETCALDWVIVGGESGHHARPMHPDWARAIRDQCVSAGVPFLFKQWGEWEAALDRERDDPDWRADYSNVWADAGHTQWINLAGGRGFHGDRFHVMRRVGKGKAGRDLDGRTWDGVPV